MRQIDKNSEHMEPFKNIRFKKKTAERFQEFSRTHFKTHSEALATMLDFFFYNEISPKEKLGPTGRKIENSLKKRMNAIIAIMKDVEKNKANPTLAILQSLLEGNEPKKKTLILEKNSSRKEDQNKY